MPRVSIKDLDSTEKGAGSDMNLYFHGTFIKLSSDGVKAPVWTKYVGFHPAKGHQFADESTSLIIVDAMDPKAYVEWDLPTGWFNFKYSAVYGERIPKRQYLKGICSHSYKFNTAESIAKDHGIFQKCDDAAMQEALKFLSSGPHAPVTINHIKAIFDTLNPYKSLEEACGDIKTKKAFCRALTADLAIIPHPQNKEFLIFCEDLPVAELSFKNSKVNMIVPEFKPECSAYFGNEGVFVA